jgi:1,4-dihydroxy-2-naphthoate octaprenyltransferase
MNSSRAGIWLAAARPKTWGASLAPVALGAALAFHDGELHIAATVVALASALLIQVGTNFANDYYDFKKGADAKRVGPVRATQAGLVSPEAMMRAAVIAFTIAVILGSYLVAIGGTPILCIGLLSVLFGILYTAGPYPLAYVGLGELFVLIFFGPVAVAGTYYLSTLRISADAMVLGLLPGSLSVAILTVNNLRDYRGDLEVSKKTLVVRLGRAFGRFEYALFTALPVPVMAYFATQIGPLAAATLCSTSLVAASILAFALYRKEGAALNPFLPFTNLLLLVISAALAFALAQSV